VAVSEPDTAEDNQILVENQRLPETITCGNCITTVKNKSVYISLINPTENPIQIRNPNLEQLVHEEYNEAYVHTTQVQEQSETPIERNRIPLLHEALRIGHLNEKEQSALLSICNDYSDIFFLDGDKIMATTEIAHEIRTSEAVQPINDKPYRLPQRHRQEITDQMEALERDGIITPSDSPWNAPLLVVPKKPDINGKVKYRVCVDFRKLNQVTVGDAFPLLNITDILDQLGKSKYYTTLDLAQGYH